MSKTFDKRMREVLNKMYHDTLYGSTSLDTALAEIKQVVRKLIPSTGNCEDCNEENDECGCTYRNNLIREILDKLNEPQFPEKV